MVPVAFSIEATADFEGECKKLFKGNSKLKEALKKKAKEIGENPFHFKPLKAPLQGFRRVHLLGCFVLIYEIKEKEEKVVFVRLAHHDEAYGKKLKRE